MKKLLALILCVMMFVAVIPTAAFAATPPVYSASTTYDSGDQRVWAGAGQTNKIVEALRNNVNNIYGSYAVDSAIFSSVKTIDGILKDLVDGALKDYTTSNYTRGGLTSSSDLNDAILAGLRSTIGGSISDYLNKHYNEYYDFDSAGNRVFNPTKYAGVYAKAASGALTSEKAVAGIQAYMLYAYQRSAWNNIANKANELKNEIVGWENWGKYGFSDMARGVNGWATPDKTVDGILNSVAPNYASVLSALGQLGVNLDGSAQKVYKWVDEDGKIYNNADVIVGRTNDVGTVTVTKEDGTKKVVNVKLESDGYVPTFDLGYEGWIVDVDGKLTLSKADTDERVNSALLDIYFRDENNNEWIKKDDADPGWIVSVYEQAGSTINTRSDETKGFDSYNWANYDYNDGKPVVDDYTRDSYSNDQWTGYWY